MTNRFHTDGLKETRAETLCKELKILIDWLHLRTINALDHDELTTLTMLSRKVDRIKERVQKAGYLYLTQHSPETKTDTKPETPNT